MIKATTIYCICIKTFRIVENFSAKLLNFGSLRSIISVKIGYRGKVYLSIYFVMKAVLTLCRFCPKPTLQLKKEEKIMEKILSIIMAIVMLVVSSFVPGFVMPGTETMTVNEWLAEVNEAQLRFRKDWLF